MKKLLIIGIIALFISLAVIPSTGISNIEKTTYKQSTGITLYVGGNGPNNYTKIQDAIDNSSDGDTVFVYDDSSPYNEYIAISKSINLIGEDKNTTVIEGFKKRDVIHIYNSDSVSITGFTINRSGNENIDAGIQIYTSYNNIYDNIFSENRKGIILYKTSHYCNIYNNFFVDNFQGIDADKSNNNNFYENMFYSNSFGIVIDEGIDNKISNNIFQENGDGIFFLNDAKYNEIFDNDFIENFVDGIYVGGTSNYFYGNNFTNNFCGIEISYQSTNNLVERNYFSKNKCGIEIGWDGNIIEKNRINDNELGIKINWGVNNKIISNIIENNNIGLYITGTSYKNSITCNNFFNNSGTFMHPFPDIFFLRNYWDSNYWDSLLGNVKIISGNARLVIYSWVDTWGELHQFIIYPPWFTIDWHPAKEPYDI